MHLACKFVFKLPGNRKIIGKHKIVISKFIRLLIVIICTKISSLSKLYVSLDFFFQISTNLKLSIYKINFSWRISNFIYLAKNPQDSPLRVVIATVALGMTGGGRPALCKSGDSCWSSQNCGRSILCTTKYLDRNQ